MGPSPHLSFSACKTATLAYEILLSIGPSPHLWFLYAKQRLVDQHTSLYGHQTSPVILCIQTRVISSRITTFYGFHPSSVVLYMKIATLGPDLQVCMGPRPHLWFLYAKQRLVDQHKSLYGYQTSPMALCMQNGDFRARITSFYGTKTPHVVFASKTATSGAE